MKNTQKGFTLIELLVVIAIIGILSSIVIASLNSARTKGAVSAAKGQLAQLRTQAEVYYDQAGNGNTYGPAAVAGAATSAACTGFAVGATTTNGIFSDPIIKQQLSQISANGTAMACYAGSQVWAVSLTLKDGKTYCVDNAGTSKESSTANATTGACS